ncbi:hypothetical protein, partial [Roseomonas chloroacetimidivorans]|uniref:hypothetical protein n=1 Tax=Roseomonas chloroacetimidivorans TaxID=1766656 RepID=UPI003C7346AE
MNAIQAAVQVITNRTQPARIPLGSTANVVAVFRGYDLKPAAVDGVTFLWVRPDGSMFETDGVGEAGTPPPMWRGAFEVDVDGPWAVRAKCETPARELEWFRFEVYEGPADITIPPGAIWTTQNKDALTTSSGALLSALRVNQLEAGSDLDAGGMVLYVTPTGETKALSGQAVLDAATAVVQPIAETVTTTAAAVQEARVEVAGNREAVVTAAGEAARNAETVTTTAAAVQEARVEVARQLLGATPYAATLNGDATVITQTIDG